MQKQLLALCLLAFAPFAVNASGANYAECILSEMPGTQSGPVHGAVVTTCTKSHPDLFFTIKRGAGRGVLGYATQDACTIAKGKNTSWQPSAALIRASCGCLYGDSSGPTDMCARFALPAEIRDQHPDAKTDAAQLGIEHHYRRIYQAHPDADAIFNTKPFWQWVATDKAREKAVTRGTTSQVIDVLADYKRSAVLNPFSDPNFGK